MGTAVLPSTWPHFPRFSLMFMLKGGVLHSKMFHCYLLHGKGGQRERRACVGSSHEGWDDEHS